MCSALKPVVLSGLFELFDMLLICTFVTFSDMPLATLLDEAAPQVGLNHSNSHRHICAFLGCLP